MSTIAPPKVDELHEILPEEPLLLMGAGPVPIAPSVARANSVVINHVGPTMSHVVASLRVLAQYVFQTESEKILGVAGPATAAMEMAITNLLWEGRTALVLNNGTFGARWADIARQTGAEVIELQRKPDDIKPFTAKEVAKQLSKQAVDVVIITHGETSSGVLTDLEAVAQVAEEHGCLTIVDAVTTLGAREFQTDKWHIDAVVAGGQKALGSIPGVSLLAFSARAWEVIETRTAPTTHWTLDAKAAWKFWGSGGYHYTAPVPGVLALFEALTLIKKEGLPARCHRQYSSSSTLQEAVEALGLELFVPKHYRLPSVVAITVPKGVDGDAVRSFMRENHGVEISGAFGHNIIRIGQMSEQCRPEALRRTVKALAAGMQHKGVKIDLNAGLNVLDSVIQ